MNLNSTDDNIKKGDVDIVFGSAKNWMSEEWRRELKDGKLGKIVAEIAADEVHVVLEWYIFESLLHLVGVQGLPPSLSRLNCLKIYIVFINVVLTFWREKGNTDCIALSVLRYDLLIILNYESFQPSEIVGLRLMHIGLCEIELFFI